jgi:outer membrane biosynthesis protein TonB
MRTTAATLIWIGVIAASLGLHVAVFGGFGRGAADGRAARKHRPAALVEMTVDKPKVAPPPAQPPPPKAAPRLAVARPLRAAARPAAAQPRVAPAAPPPAAEAPADFTGMTLTNDGAGAGWASATGNGEAMRGPVGRPGARATGRSVEGAPAAAPRKRAEPVVGIDDLSRRPEAPELASVLERFYPASARSKGIAGRAVVRARVTPDGELRELALLSETGMGFGAACRQTLEGSRWTPPLDRAGKPVSTVINYTCRFEVQ